MSEKKQKKYTKIGAVLKGNYGPFIVMGDDRSKNEQYHYDVQIMVKNAKGEKVALVKNPMITLRDPRNFVKKDGTSPNVPEKVMWELSIVEDVND